MRNTNGWINENDLINKKEPYYSKILKRFESNFVKEINDECWEWIGLKYENHYGRFVISINKQGSCYRANRLSMYFYKNFNLFSKLEILHTCDNPSCVNPNHLFEGTKSDNMLDSVNKGRHNKSRNLTQDQVNEMLAMKVIDNKTEYEIAEKFNVSQSFIHTVLSGNHRLYKV